MSDPRWQRLWDLFFAALEHSGAQRDAFVAKACAGDAELGIELQQLLAAHAGAPDPLSRPPQLQAPEPSWVGRQIGRYRLLREVGSGGMGTVYEAEQEQPLRRRVALKLIKLGMDTREVVMRFEAERQALALMNHAHIAQVFDAGASDDGRPYFVMEFVDGVPLTDWCDAQGLPLAARLALFVQVCEGVQHAHHKGVIHRDIKPANVLVSLQDGVAVPKIIDFGVAKAIHAAAAADSARTQLGMLIGTPAYMSPEQFDPDGSDADTRTDVYALGVLLHELLAGVLPFDPSGLRGRSLAAMQRALREAPLQRPSLRVAAMPRQQAETIARCRGSSAAELPRLLRGELDWILLQALARERSERYASPGDLAADVRAYLQQRPIRAHPPSLGYRLRKLLLRHRWAAAAASLALLGLVAVAIAMTSQALRLRRALTLAEEHSRRAQQATDFLVTLFEQAEPQAAKGRALTVREVLDAGAAKVDQELAAQPAVAADLHFTLGVAYRALGDYAQGARHVEAAWQLRRRRLGDEHALTLDALSALAQLRWDAGDHAAAEQLARQALAGQDRVLPPDHEQRLYTLNTLALSIKRAGRYDEAEPLYRELLEARRRTLGAEHRSTLIAMNNLARLLEETGRIEAAARLLQEVADTSLRVYGDDDPDTLIAFDTLGVIQRKLGHHDEAERLHRLALAGSRRVLGERHFDTLAVRRHLATLLLEQNRLAEAEQEFRETLAGLNEQFGESSFYTMSVARELGDCLLRQKRFAEARVLLLQARQIAQTALPPEHEGHRAIARLLAEVERHAAVVE